MNTNWALLSTDKTITLTDGWVDLLSTTIQVDLASSRILAIFSADGAHFSAGVTYNSYFRILLDGAEVIPSASAGGVIPAVALFATGGLGYFPALSTGVHTVTLQWSTDNSDARILAASNANLYHTSLYVEECPTIGSGLLLAERPPKIADLAVDSTAPVGGTFGGLHSTTYTTVGPSSRLLVQVALSTKKITNNGTTVFRVKVNGATQAASSFSKDPTLAIGFHYGSAPIVVAPVLAAGTHTIAVEWRTDSADVLCNPVGDPERTGCRLLLQEK